MTGENEGRAIRSLEKIAEAYEASTRKSEEILSAVNNIKITDYSSKIDGLLALGQHLVETLDNRNNSAETTDKEDPPEKIDSTIDKTNIISELVNTKKLMITPRDLFIADEVYNFFIPGNTNASIQIRW